MAVDKQIEPNSGIVADDACYELMFVKEKNIALISNGHEHGGLLPPTYTVNNMSPPFRFDYDGTFTTFCIKLQPWQNAAFVPNHLPSGLLNLTSLYGESIVRLHQQLFSVQSFAKRIDYAEEFLLSLSPTPSPSQVMVKEVCEHIYGCKGSVLVKDLANKFSVSRQHLAKVFLGCVKYSLKRFIIQIRIRFAMEYKLKHPDVSLTNIAYKFGYYDQAHFVNDVRKIVGVTPSSFINRESYSCNLLRGINAPTR